MTGSLGLNVVESLVDAGRVGESRTLGGQGVLRGHVYKHLLTPQIGNSMTNQSKDTSKVQLGELIIFIGIKEIWVMGYLNKSRNDLKKCQTHHQKSTPVWVAAHKSWNPRAYCMTGKQLDRLESVSSKQLSLSGPLLGSLAGLSLF